MAGAKLQDEEALFGLLQAIVKRARHDLQASRVKIEARADAYLFFRDMLEDGADGDQRITDYAGGPGACTADSTGVLFE